MKFKDYVPLWKGNKKDFIKISTMSAYDNTIRVHLLPAFGEMELDDIDNKKAAIQKAFKGF